MLHREVVLHATYLAQIARQIQDAEAVRSTPVLRRALLGDELLEPSRLRSKPIFASQFADPARKPSQPVHQLTWRICQ